MILMPTALNGTGRVSRRAVMHNHHRGTFELLLADVVKHFQALALAPTEILRHIGSPFAPDKDQDAPLSRGKSHNHLGSIQRCREDVTRHAAPSLA
jgi:hypothetical protein